MKKTIFMLSILALIFGNVCAKPAKGKKVKIGIAKIVQHVALDDVERGVMDAIKDAGIEADYDLQNANGDVGTAAQIAAQYKAERVDVAVGIATPIAVALATTLKNIPVVFYRLVCRRIL